MTDFSSWSGDDMDFDAADPRSGYGEEDDLPQADLGAADEDGGFPAEDLTDEPREGFGPAGETDDPPHDTGEAFAAVEGLGAADDDPGVEPPAPRADPGGCAAGLDDPLERSDGPPGGTTDVPVGADPDLLPFTDDGAWPEPVFPEPMDVGVLPEPVDGPPWIDPEMLGHLELPDLAAAHPGAPDPMELADYLGDELPGDRDPWSALAASPDPATSSLARWWRPNGSSG